MDRPVRRGKARGRAAASQSGSQRPGSSQPGQQPGGGPERATPGPRPQQSTWGPPASASARQQQSWGPPVGTSSQQPLSWGPRPLVLQQHQIRGPAPSQKPPQAGRASHRGAGDIPGPEKTHQGKVTSGGDGDSHVMTSDVRRGGTRGGRRICENIIWTRPTTLSTKKGTSGSFVTLRSNYFNLMHQSRFVLYQYHVYFDPEEDRTFLRTKYLGTSLRQTVNGFLFDGTNLYTSVKLNPDPLELFVNNDTEGAQPIRITIKFTNELQSGDYHYIQVFNIILRKCMSYLKLQLIKRNFFDAKAKIQIPEYKMELWPGYVTSIRQHEKDILLCAEITHKIMRNENVLSLLYDCQQSETKNYKQAFKDRIIGTIVLTDYNNRTYRVDDIDWNSSPASKFQKSDGSSISYIDYYKDRYKKNITQPSQPMLISRAKKREIRAGMSENVYLVPELCRLTGLTDAQRANFQLMKALGEHTRVGPSARIYKLLQFSQRLRNEPKIIEELRQWDMKLSTEIVEFGGRVLPQETIIGGEDRKYPTGKDVDWTKSLRSNPMIVSSNLMKWVLVTPNRFQDSAQQFLQVLSKAAQGMKWSISRPVLHVINDDRPPTYVQALQQVLQRENPKMILCVTSNNKIDRYAAIKKKLCVENAIPSQVMLGKNLDSRGVMSIATRVAIQMNCKLGGAPWRVQIPVSKIMFVGYDACHDPKDRRKSYGAVCASLDVPCTRYFSACNSHNAGEELSNYLALQILKACHKYREINKEYPEKITIYRDGVGEGQLNYVVEHEVKQIKKVLEENIYKEGNLRMAFIVVSKRINTRIFFKEENPLPGTVVDDVITLPERYDFFLVSQCVRQGTVSPTSYNVIYDNTGFNANQLQILTYKLTHAYYNWSGTVRVPAPCQYAHKLAFLVSQALQRDPNPGLETLLYYL